jgi:hypothetical protein
MGIAAFRRRDAPLLAVKSSKEKRSRAQEHADIIMLNVASGIFRFSRIVAAVVRRKVPELSRDFMNTGRFEWEAVASARKTGI